MSSLKHGLRASTTGTCRSMIVGIVNGPADRLRITGISKHIFFNYTKIIDVVDVTCVGSCFRDKIKEMR